MHKASEWVISGRIRCLLFKTALILVGVIQSGQATASCPQIAIPSYFYPDPPALWNQAISGAPKVGILTINPDSGPGSSPDPLYVTVADNAQAAGIQIIGYVYTGYGSRSAADVKADIDKYKNWYGVDGIFLDETSDQESLVPYYRDVADYIRSTQGSLVVLNPGVYPDESYLSVGDIVVVFEDNYAAYVTTSIPSYASNYPPSKFQHLVYGVPDSAALAQAMSLAGQRNAGYVYITPDDLENPWDTLPSYWSEELALACSSPMATGGVPAPSPAPTQPAGGAGMAPSCGTGTVWRVVDSDSGTRAIWVQQPGGSPTYSGRWSDGVSATLVVSTQGGQITFQRTDDVGTSQVIDCLYEGSFGADGTSASGTVSCNLAGGRIGPFNWSGQNSCEDPRRDFERSIDRPGADYRNFEPVIADPVQCWAQCELESQCAAWTYVNPGIQGANARCWLKSSASAPVPNVDFATSGVKSPVALRR